MKKMKNITIIALVAIIFCSSLFPVLSLAADINIGDKSDLIMERELPGLLQIKSNDALRLVIRVAYKHGNNKLPAFCIEPSKDGVGTGGGNSYTGTISQIVKDEEIWRVMYGGYLGKKWIETTVECDDDWYMVSKIAVHCIVNNTPPKTVFEVPDHVAASDGLSLAEVQRRGKKILDECEKLYWYAKNGTENYVTAKVELEKSGNLYESGNYMVQNYTLIANKEIASYDVTLQNFPTGTIYEKGSANTLKVKIPKDKIDNDYKGVIYITNAKVENYPVFYCESPKSDYQDYIVVADPFEITSTRATQKVDSHKSTLIIIKSDKEDETKIEGVVFNARYEDGENLGNYTTDANGQITIEKLRPGKLILTELSTDKEYILDKTPIEIVIKYDEMKTIEITNEHKKGNAKIYKVDKDNNKIAIGGVEFDLYSDEYQKIIGTYVTDSNGEIIIENLRTGTYKLIEKKTNQWYNLAEDTDIRIEWEETTEVTIENELKKSQIRIIKTDAEDNKIRLANVKLNILDENKNILETVITNSQGEALTQEYPVRDYPKLYVQEVETDEMYVLDDTIREIELKANSIVDLTIENEKIKGQIEIIKLDKNNNEKPLSNVKFGIYDENENLVETVITNEEGRAITGPLTKGIKYVKELATGSIYYLLNTETFEAEIKYHKEIVKLTVENEPVDIEVDVEKEGTVETKPNEEVEYTFKNIANTSNTFLDSFKWYEYLPTDYIKLEEIQTGTWNQDLNYDIYIKTNKSDKYILFKEDLNSKINHKIDLKTDFAEDEYITEFYFDFGKVDVGFKEETSPIIKCRALANLKNGDTFTNKTQTIGIYGELIDDAEDKWTTIVHVPELPEEPTLPRTGK